jgi:hypothetical protein
MEKYLIYSIVFLFFTSCTENIDGYFDGNVQPVSDRIIESNLMPNSKLLLEDFGVSSPLSIDVNSRDIIIPDFRENTISIINKDNLALRSEIKLSQGEGPGEVNRMNDVHATDEYLFVLDNSLSRILVLDYYGELLQEITINSNANRILAAPSISPEKIIVYSTNPGQKIFSIFDMEGNLLSEFGDLSGETLNPMMLGGRVHSGEITNSVFFVGRAEPIIKGFSLEGDELFSVKNIDNYNSSTNYEVREFEDGSRASSFSEDALFSANYSDVDQKYIYVIPFHNDNDQYKFIDIYNKTDGVYVNSIELEAYSGLLAVGESKLYTLGGNENQEIVIKIYKKP